MLRVSFSVSTNKPNYWHRFCEALSHNNAEVEVVFVGICNGHEDLKLPVPAKFIPTPVNPAQCWEIGVRMATGDVICLAADDCIFTPGAVDDVVKKLMKVNNMFDMVTAKYLFDGNDYLFAMRCSLTRTCPSCRSAASLSETATADCAASTGVFARSRGTRTSTGVVDDAVKALLNTDNMYDMASAKYFFNDQDYYFGMYMFSQMHMPLLPMGGFTLAESHRNIGGIDRRFKCVVWDTDLYMRFCEAGGHTILMENHKYHEKGGLNGLYARDEHIDVPTLRSFWTRDGQLSTKRTCAPLPFNDKDILTVNQFGS